MKQQLVNQWQHLPSKDQAAKESEKKVSHLLQSKNPLTWKDLQGLSWTLFEEEDL